MNPHCAPPVRFLCGTPVPQPAAPEQPDARHTTVLLKEEETHGSELLEGMKVIEIAAFMAAPMGGRILGEWGADVIKVEPPTGDSNRGIGLARHIYNGDQPAGTPSTPASAASRWTPASPRLAILRRC